MACNLAPSWYHKTLSRMEAEKQLNKINQPGCFVVRESESLPNTRVLSLLTSNGINHYRIQKSKDGKCFLAATEGSTHQYFESIEHLISYFQVQREQLPVPLNIPIPDERTSAGSGFDDSDVEDEMEISNDQDVLSNIATFFLHQFQMLKGKSKDEKFEKFVESYIKKQLVHDLYRAENGVTKLPYLHQLVLSAAEDLQKSVDVFVKKLLFLQSLFDVGENELLEGKENEVKDHSALSKNMQQPCNADVEGLFQQVESCKSLISELQIKSCKVMKDYSGKQKVHAKSPREETYEVVCEKKNKKRSSQGICQFFLAYKSNKKTKAWIAVNMKEGTVAFLKSPEDYQDPSNSVSHKAITQLLKDESSKTSLGITMNRKISTYHFEDFKSRELFCLMIEKMKSTHSDQKNKGVLTQVSVFVGTWNMGSAQFPEDISSWLKCSGWGKDKIHDADSPYDIVAIGIQESGASEKELVTKIKEVLKKLFNIDYSLVTKGNLWDIRLAIFIKPMHMSQVSEVKQSIVKLGLANALGNKGAVGVSFNFGSTSFCFINSHLQARVERLAKRNQNFHDTIRNLNLGQQGLFDVSNHFHHLFWFGDLNYRVDGLPIEDVLKKIIGNDLESLLDYDQLNRERRIGNAFFGFEEERITFRPTYRYKVGSHNMYIWLKKKPGTTVTNVPSWPDRVLRKSFPEIYITNTSYGSTMDIVTSDHAPVFSTFDVGLIAQSQGLGCDTIRSEQNRASIEFLHAEAKLRTSCKTRFILVFESSCLEAQKESKPNSIPDWRSGRREINTAYSYPGWKIDDLLKLSPALSNQKYLEDQHIKIAVKADDGHESYGECILALKRLVLGGTKEVECCLSHLGDESGEIKFMMRIKTDINENINPVITNVNDLQSIRHVEDDGDSGVSTDMRRASFASSHRQSIDAAMPGNYELVSDFTDPDLKSSKPAELDVFRHRHSSMPGNYVVVGELVDPDLPPIPPKKRLSKQLSNPLIAEHRSDASSEIIWIGDQGSGPTHRYDHRSAERDHMAKRPAVPVRQSSIRTSEENAQKPVPKPRLKSSLARNMPKNVREWLQQINLPQYEQLLVDSGWDDLGYLDFSNDDLIDAGVHSEEHRQILMKSAEMIKNKKTTQ